MQPKPIRFSEAVWSLVQVEAQHLGVSAADFVRASALSYAMFCRGRRGGPWAEGMEELRSAALKILAADERYGDEA